ncbi:MAG: DegT/DnrJ/EryC1/StrS family aminotransferase [Sphaerochaetaceae bacterium]|nr:DegT/DnrJ/EryC1/StrS family aminotransferase [Sphaerochaetaceae bacterium]
MIPQIQPWIDEEELKEIVDVVKSTWLTESIKTAKFEEMFKDLSKAKYAYAFSNGTVTLFTALKVLGIGQDDEVIVPNLTFVATINPIILVGAKPVLVDIDPETFCINADLIEEKITSKTKAIMPVHLYGQSAEMDKIMSIAKKHNLYVIEDAAQAVGVLFDGKHAGTFGDFGSFSFYGNKTVTTGEGGMIVTNDEHLAKEAYQFKNHGRLEKGKFIHEKIGMNFSFTEMQAAIGIVQLGKLQRIIKKKNEIREFYIKELSGIKGIRFPKIHPKCNPVHWFTSIMVEDAEKLGVVLKEKGIQTRRFFYPVNRQPAYNEFNFEGNFPITEWAYKSGISLPSSYTITDEELKTVCDAIKEAFK